MTDFYFFGALYAAVMASIFFIDAFWAWQRKL